MSGPGRACSPSPPRGASAAPVAAGDIDGVAVAAARDNARRNAAAPAVRPVRAVGVAHPSLRAGAPYDLIFGNILARPLRALAPALRRLAAPGAEVILSGLLATDVPGVVAAYRVQGFALVARRNVEGWATLLLRRPFEPTSLKSASRKSLSFRSF